MKIRFILLSLLICSPLVGVEKILFTGYGQNRPKTQRELGDYKRMLRKKMSSISKEKEKEDIKKFKKRKQK